MKRTISLAASAAAVLALAGGAGAFVAAQVYKLHRGDRAAFEAIDGWSCVHLGKSIRCRSGGTFPYVELTSTSSAGNVVRVYTLAAPNGGRFSRIYVKGLPVYVFSSF